MVVQRRQWAAWISGRDAVGSFGVGVFVAWGRRILSVSFVVSSCEFLRQISGAAWDDPLVHLALVFAS